MKQYGIFYSREITAGKAMVTFVHKKGCLVFGKDVLEQADFLQIGQDKMWISGGGGTWGTGIGGFISITYIQCSRCGVKKVFQERN